MKVNHNITAQIANINLKKDERRVATSLERLSSGYKITKAADDSAGMAISNKMRTQIRALDQASRNAEDGQSIVQTADGALNEITAMLQRVRELSVQAANDTYTIDDRNSAQKEVDQLLDEIDRISSTTEFNGKKLLDGSSSRSFTSNVDEIRAVSTSMSVPSGKYSITVTAPPEPATVTGSFTIPASGSSTMRINGADIKINSTDSVTTVNNKIFEACDMMDIRVDFTASSNFTLTTKTTGFDQQIELRMPGQNKIIANGEDAKVTPSTTATPPVLAFSTNAKASADGSKVTIKDNSGFEMVIEVPENAQAGKRVELDVYNAGYMGMQIGANEKQSLYMNFEEVTCRTLALREADGQNRINLCSQHSASVAIGKVDDAIAKVSAVRAELGAYENRLESTVSSLDVASYNITNSMSRIMDTDMADEMTQYTQLSVLQQAATTMLSQANSKPQEVMNLLQGM